MLLSRSNVARTLHCNTMCRPPTKSDASAAQQQTDSMAGLKIAGCALTAAGLTTLLPASDAFVTKPDRAVCLQATFLIFVMLWAYEFAARTLLGQ